MVVGEAHHKKLGHGLKILFILVLPQVGLVHSIFAFSGKAVENYNKDKECMSNRNPGKYKNKYRVSLLLQNKIIKSNIDEFYQDYLFKKKKKSKFY